MTLEPSHAASVRLNPGETLRKARESRGWSLQEVAQQLNLTAQRLEFLEAGAFEKLPGHTFSRGYLRAYAKLLGLDPQHVVVQFDQYTGTDAAGSNVQSLGRIEEPGRMSQSILRLVSILVLLVLLAAGFFWWQGNSPERAERSAIPEHVEVESADGTTQLHPLTEPEDAAVVQGQLDVPQPPIDISAELTAPDDSTDTATAAAEPSPVEQPVEQPAEQPASAPPVPVTPADAPAPVEPPTAAPTPVTPPADAVAPAVAAAGEGLLEIAFSEACWIEVTDGRGKILHSSLKRKGESLQLAGKTPLKVHLGYASATQVRFNGQPVDVARYARGETARMILGQ